MLRSHLLFCPYIQCVCLRISKKTGGNQEINSINSIFFFFQPHLKVSGCRSWSQSQQEQNTAWVNRDCSVFDSGVVKWECFNQAAWAEVILREHSAGGVSGLSLRPRSQCQVPPLFGGKKVQGPVWQTDALCVPVCEDRQWHCWLLLCSSLHSVPRQEGPKCLNELAI